MNPLAALSLATLRVYSHIAPTERGGYRLARLARKLVPRRNWNNTFVIPGGTRLQLDLSTYPDCCMAVGLYELDTLRLLRKLLKPGDHFVDCGANLGYFTLAAAAHVGPAGRVDAFEPDPLNRARLERNLSANESPAHVHVHAVALSSAAGQATLYHPIEDARNHGEASLFAPAGVETQAYTVATARLDQQLDHAPNLIKMDIEGAELSALHGMENLLKLPNPPGLIIEHNPQSAAAAGHQSGDLLRCLQECNPAYRAAWIGWCLSAMSSPQSIDATERQGNIFYHIA